MKSRLALIADDPLVGVRDGRDVAARDRGPAAADAAIAKAIRLAGFGALGREVAAGNITGAPSSRIATQLWITEQTVKFHLANVCRKLGVSNRTEASHHAHVHGLLETKPAARIAA
jgi:DNA-binding CsgD family transcriptional regulator